MATPSVPDSSPLPGFMRSGEIDFTVNFTDTALTDEMRNEWIAIGSERTIVFELPRGQVWPKHIRKGTDFPIAIDLDLDFGGGIGIHHAEVKGKVLWRRKGKLVVRGRIELVQVTSLP